jgi:hypothetical protein
MSKKTLWSHTSLSVGASPSSQYAQHPGRCCGHLPQLTLGLAARGLRYDSLFYAIHGSGDSGTDCPGFLRCGGNRRGSFRWLSRDSSWSWLIRSHEAKGSREKTRGAIKVAPTTKSSYRSASWHGAYSANRRVQDTVEVGTTSVTSPNHRRR